MFSMRWYINSWPCAATSFHCSPLTSVYQSWRTVHSDNMFRLKQLQIIRVVNVMIYKC